MNFLFSNLLGSPYRGGNLLIQGHELFSAVGNRIAVVDLVNSAASTLPFECAKQVRLVVASPDNLFLLAIDEDGRCLVINKLRRALLHRFTFKNPVGAAKYSPDGAYIACGVGRILQVWQAPGAAKTFAPMELYRTYGGSQANITSLDWSEDSFWIVVASKDLTARIFTLDPVEGYKAPTLAGHKDTIVACFFAGAKVAEDAQLTGGDVHGLYTLSRDGALFCWSYERGVQPYDRTKRRRPNHRQYQGRDDEDSAEAAGPGPGSEQDARAAAFSGGSWKLCQKHYFNKRGATQTAAAFHKPTGMLVAGFSSGTFELFEMPAFTSIHALSISHEAVTSLCFNGKGDWLALGCAALGQLLVWEWRSETYVLKQQGHYYDISAVAYSPDGAYLATGAEDAKVKLWTPSSGFCFVTFSEHTAPVTGVAFLPNSAAVVSCSLDGTVRAYDLIRYRNFRTMTSPTAQQFGCVAVDPSGEVVVAGSVDEFQICVWAVKTARLLDILAAHEGPVSALAFSPTQSLLASASWDKTVRTWDIFSGRGGLEVLQHNHDVLAVAFRPDGKLLASATLDGQIYLWNPQDAVIEGTIEGRRDLAGGRRTTDRRAAGNSTSGQCFTSLAFSADGSWLLAGGASKYVCLYDVAERVLLRRFQISANRSLDGVMDQLNSRNVTDAGPLDLIDDAPSDDDDLLHPREVNEGLVFDPTDLGHDITPQAAHAALESKHPLRALLIALRLRDSELLQHTLLSTPPAEVQIVAAGLPTSSLPAMLAALVEALNASPHLEFVLDWVKAVCIAHGAAIQNLTASAVQPALRALQRVVAQLHDQLTPACDSNLYTLRYLSQAPRGENL